MPSPTFGWTYRDLHVELAPAHGEVLIHIESGLDDSRMDDLILGRDSAPDNVELLIKVLDAPADADHSGWLLG